MENVKNQNVIRIPRATGLLIIVVENSNPNGDPDQESDPRRRSHDNRGMITGVSFKRKVRDLIIRKDEVVWPLVAESFGITSKDGIWSKGDLQFDILESRGINRQEVNALLNEKLDDFKRRFWDARVFGNTFLEEGMQDTVRSGVVHFVLGTSVAPIRIHRLTKTKLAPAQSGRDGAEGPTRGMAPLAHRVVEHAVYTMPFFVNPTGAKGEKGTGCQPVDVALMLQLIRYAYPHTKSDIRPLVEIRHAWYAEHKDELGSFSEFDFIERLTPRRMGGNRNESSVSGIPLLEQYEIPQTLADETNKFNEKLKDGKLYDLCSELPPWCNSLKNGAKNE